MKKLKFYFIAIAISSMVIVSLSFPRQALSAAPVQPVHNSTSKLATPVMESLLLIAALWLIAVNTTEVRRWQMFKILQKQSINIPDTDLDGLVTVPETVAHSAMVGANGSNEWTVSQRLDLVAEEPPLYRAALASALWYGKILGSDAGVVEHGAADSAAPITNRPFFVSGKLFLLGQDSPVWNILSLLPYGRFCQKSYVQAASGRWFLVIVCPWFRITRIGTLVPSRGFVIKVDWFGIPTIITLVQAKELFPPTMSLFPAKLANEYAKAYVKWSPGLLGRFFKRSKPLGFFDGACESLEEPSLVRFAEIGNQYAIFLGPDKGHGAALNAVLLFDARTGEPRIYRRLDDEINFGPSSAIALVRNTHGRHHHKIAAPRLIVRDGEIYWLVTLLSALLQDEGIVILGHYLVSARTGDFVPMSAGPRAVLQYGVSAIEDAITQV